MSDILTIRLPEGEKEEWERAASAVKESVADYVRSAVRLRARSGERSPWDKHVGSIDIAVPPPTNLNVRRALARRRRRRL